jgi:plastocyanin domain-containing protein
MGSIVVSFLQKQSRIYDIQLTHEASLAFLTTAAHVKETSMKNTLKYILLISILTLVSTVSAIGESDSQIKKVTPEINGNGIQKVEIIGGSHFFDPNYIIVKKNVPVELEFTKDPGMVPHDVAMDSPEAGIDFKFDISDTPKSATFTPTKVGKYPFYCTKKLLFFESHSEKGMKGTLEVRE